MNGFDRITKSPLALADFLQAIPAISARRKTATTARMKPFGAARFGI